ncbi:MAG: hypothetical protein KDI88_03830 [Gammaproteobacteria bacterium]|nr:hypothetical protein [Gammaproteobacteria bacterium]
MRVIYLLLAFFVLTGIGATCRTTLVQASGDCTAAVDCSDRTATDTGG